MGRIQTGVDRLVNLLHEKKKLSVDEGAKALGVSKAILQEWADFLEEEGLLEIKYSLSKTYLVERPLSKHEFEQKEKQFETQRETFINKVEATIAQLNTETANFENFKKKFEDLKKDLGGDLEHIQEEVKELREYESLKTNITQDLEKTRMLFAKKQQETDVALQRQYKQYHDVIASVTDQEAHLNKQKDKVHALVASEESVTKKIDEYTKLLDQLRSRIGDETRQLGLDEKSLDKLRHSLGEFKDDIEELEEKNLKPLEKMRQQHEAQIKEIEGRILEKAKRIDASTKVPLQEKQAVKKRIEEFFNRKMEIEKLLGVISQDKQDLLAELEELQKRAEAYKLGKTSVRLEELESKLKIIEERKQGLHKHLGSFLKLLHA